MPIQLSLAEWSFLKPDQDAAEFYRSVAKLGFVGAELVKQSNYAVARAAGMRLINRQGPGKWNRVENHAQCLEELRTALQDAVENDIPAVLVFAGNRQGQADAESIAACITGLSAAALMAGAAGKLLLLEVFNKFDHPDYAADSSAFAYEAVRGVGSPHLRVLYDIYHMLRMGEDVDKTLFDDLDLVGHVHIARSPDRKIATDDVSIGLIGELDRQGYAGYVGAEWLADKPVEELAAFMERVKRT